MAFLAQTEDELFCARISWTRRGDASMLNGWKEEEITLEADFAWFGAENYPEKVQFRGDFWGCSDGITGQDASVIEDWSHPLVFLATRFLRFYFLAGGFATFT